MLMAAVSCPVAPAVPLVTISTIDTPLRKRNQVGLKKFSYACVIPFYSSNTLLVFLFSGKAAPVAKGCVVCVRVRPESIQEISSGGTICVSTKQTGDGSATLLLTGLRDHQYSFRYDFVFDQDATQENVYCSTCLPLVDKLLAGYSASVIAYGQTGAGKSYTMIGDCSSEDFHSNLTDPTTRGVIPRILEALVRRTETLSQQNSDTAFSIRGSLIEIYNETVRDLLAPGRDNLVIRESTPATVITDATEVPISCPAQALEVIKAGFANRALGTTLSNDKSSRSHAVLQITIQRDSILDCTTKSSQLFLVDLAGSERVSKADTAGDRLRETQNINRSLLALGNVISAVPPTGGSRKHIPYRESKLTRLLQHSLGGNAFTVVLLCCSPHSFNVRETLSTLRFGDRAAHIHNKPQATETLSPMLLQKRLVESQTQLRFSQARLRACVTQSARRIEAIKMLQKYIPEGVQLSDEDTALLRKAIEDCAVLNSFVDSAASAASPKKLVSAPKSKPRVPLTLGASSSPSRQAAAHPDVAYSRPKEFVNAGGHMPRSDNVSSLTQGSELRLTSSPPHGAFEIAPSHQAGQYLVTSRNSAHPKEKYLLKTQKQQHPQSPVTGVGNFRQQVPEAVPQLPPKQRPAEFCAVVAGQNSDDKMINQDPADAPQKTPNADCNQNTDAGMFDRALLVGCPLATYRALYPTSGQFLETPLV
ncbi:putative kinesin [Toxoplasma gondii TgCatPRC2]|uniref:Kinesin-like protein n=1 Tax=Toxoplasma gondii TgCatPRC2 TaxID=1130821 RepID=A0A151HHP0_TOXGO|nr:putative kinesin [Toxoplasma gondii TgCatPRC2]